MHQVRKSDVFQKCGSGCGAQVVLLLDQFGSVASHDVEGACLERPHVTASKVPVLGIVPLQLAIDKCM